MKKITSSSNPEFKGLKKLLDKKGRDNSGQFLVEGLREIKRASQSGFTLLQLIICEDFFSDEAKGFLNTQKGVRLLEVSSALFNQLIVRKDREGVLAVFEKKSHLLSEISPRLTKKNLSLLIIENCEKPGNLGAMIRSADGCGVDGLIIIGSADIYHPNAIRASLGAVFSVPIFYGDRDEVMHLCGDAEIQIYAACLTQKSKSLWHTAFKHRSALLLGSESSGVDAFWLERKDVLQVMIPMAGICDSLNVSVAAAVFLYERARQTLIV